MEHRNLPDEPEPLETERHEPVDAREGNAHPGTPVPRDPEDERQADGRRDVTPSSQGAGAIWGDAERTPNPGPIRPPSPDDQARMDAVAAEYEVATTEEGENYLTPREGADPKTAHDDFPDHSAG